MASSGDNNVDYRLLDRLSNLVICSTCFQAGRVTPVPQVISDRHMLQNTCAECRAEQGASVGSECDNGQEWPSSISIIRR